MVVTEYAPGAFCWTDLSTSDAPAAKAFYGSLFGWTHEDMPIDENMVYTMLNLNGNEVGALYQESRPGVPPHWQTYITTASADDTAAKAKSLGGTVLAEPFDVFDVGRQAVIQDPTGAVFSVWQPRSHIGATVVDEPGATCWFELNTRDTEKALTFYVRLFGYGTKGHDTGYTEFQVNGKSVGGMMAITPQMGDHVPPHWLVYFQVADCDDSVTKAKSLGAQSLAGPMDVPNVGRFAVIQDPQGAVFAVFTLASAG